MSDDWQPGDLALCVRGGYLYGDSFGPFPKAGAVYTVAGKSKFASVSFLLVEGAPDNVDSHRNWGPLWDAVRFRKIRPYKADEEDRETIRLLTGAPVKEQV